jgi:hypothetical protein
LYQYAAPRAAACQFGIPVGSDPASTIMMRGAGARDCITGSALLYSASCDGDYRPWLAVRAAADAADGIAGVLSLIAGTECARQRKTTRSALVLAGIELFLWWISSLDSAFRAGLHDS